MKYKSISVLENIRCQYLWEIPRCQYCGCSNHLIKKRIQAPVLGCENAITTLPGHSNMPVRLLCRFILRRICLLATLLVEWEQVGCG